MLRPDDDNERSKLLQKSSSRNGSKNVARPKRSLSVVIVPTLVLGILALVGWLGRAPSSPTMTTRLAQKRTFLQKIPLVGQSKSKTLSEIDWPDPFSRCEYVVDVMTNFVRGDDVKATFLAQSQDPNVFYRATARLFWRDFGSNSYENQTTHWTESDFQTYWIQDLKIKGTNVSLKSLWTWTTGDQHLSNFGAWRNRHGDVVFGVNDFDEGALNQGEKTKAWGPYHYDTGKRINLVYIDLFLTFCVEQVLFMISRLMCSELQ